MHPPSAKRADRWSMATRSSASFQKQPFIRYLNAIILSMPRSQVDE